MELGFLFQELLIFNQKKTVGLLAHGLRK